MSRECFVEYAACFVFFFTNRKSFFREEKKKKRKIQTHLSETIVNAPLQKRQFLPVRRTGRIRSSKSTTVYFSVQNVYFRQENGIID